MNAGAYEPLRHSPFRPPGKGLEYSGFPVSSLLLRWLMIACGWAVIPSLLSGQAWELPYLRFSVEEGLPGSEVHELFQDSKGYLWIGTDHGLARYDGRELSTYSNRDGLPGNVILGITESPDGHVWFHTLNGGLCRFDGRQFTLHPAQDALKPLLNNGWIRNLAFDSRGDIWIAPLLGPHHLIRLREDGAMAFSLAEKDRAGARMFLKPLNGHPLYTYLETLGGKQGKLVLSRSSDSLGTHYFVHGQSPNNNGLTLLEDGRMLIACGKDLYVFLDTTLKAHYTNLTEGDILEVYDDREGNAWICTEKGVYLFYGGDFESAPTHLFPGEQITGVLMGREGGHWVSTLNNGVYFIPSLYIQTWSEEVEITALCTDSLRLWAGTSDGNIWHSDDRGAMVEAPVSFAPANINALSATKNGDIWAAPRGEFAHRIYPTAPPKVLSAGNISNILELENGDLLLAAHQTFAVYRDTELLVMSRLWGFEKRVTSACQDLSGTVWIGTVDGLYSWDGHETVHHAALHPALAGTITSLDVWRKDGLAIGTKGNGLLLWKNGIIRQVDLADGLISDMVRCMWVTDEEIFAGTNKGLSRLSLPPGSLDPAVHNYSVWDGLPSREVNAIRSFSGHLWLGTGKGLCRLDTGDLNHWPAPPLIWLTGLQVNHCDTSLHSAYALEADQRNLLIRFNGVHLNGGQQLVYRYRMLGLDTHWYLTSDRTVQYTMLAPGNYRFEVMAGNNQGVWNPQPATFSVHIPAYFTETWSFYVLFSTLVALGVTLLSLAIIRHFRRRHDLEKEVLVSNQTALRAQMNPHFIFNSLNSVLHFITDHDRQSAADFLTKLTSLIRMTFQNSDRNWISLEEELTMLRHYLEVEKMRFGSKAFDYAIDCEKGLALHGILIPSMLIQPFAENAIWHGLMPKKGGGRLKVYIRKNGNRLHIAVDDNGIGRERARQINRKRRFGHTSAGLKNASGRIALLNRLFKRDITMEITDKPEAGGTTVTLSLLID